MILCAKFLFRACASISRDLPSVCRSAKLAKGKTTVQMMAIGFLIVGNAAHPVVPKRFQSG